MSWSSPSGQWINDPHAWVFKLGDNACKMAISTPQRALRGNASLGPCFGNHLFPANCMVAAAAQGAISFYATGIAGNPIFQGAQKIAALEVFSVSQ